MTIGLPEVAMWLNSKMPGVRFIISLSVLVLLSSCVKDREALPQETGQSYAFTVGVETPENMTGNVRSSFTQGDLERISDLNVFVYHDGSLLRECSRYFCDMSSLMLSFPVGMDGFNIYLLGNVGEVAAPDNEDEICLLSHVVDSYEDFRRCGFPLAHVYRDFRKGDLAHFKLKRLVGQYDVRMHVSAADAEYFIKEVRLLNCAKDVYPFGNDVRASVFGCSTCVGRCLCGDCLSQEDIDALNSGESVTLYLLENIQGVLLPDNTDRKQKIPSSIELVQSGLSECCTYMEITADVTTPAARYADAKYRFYLGQDQTTDFSIRRNTLYEVVLDFTQNMVSEEEWRIETGDAEVVEVNLSKDIACVIKGVEDMVYVQAFGNDGSLLDFDVRIMSSNRYVNVDKVQTFYQGLEHLGGAVGLRFTSNVQLAGLYAYDSEPSYKTETVRISSRETHNGVPLYEADIEVRVYYKLFPLLIRLERSYGRDTDPYRIVLRSRNPMGLGLAVSSSYAYGASVATTPTIRNYDYILDTGARVDMAVRTSGAGFAELQPDVSISNLSFINFYVSGVSEVSGKTLAYPKLLASEQIHTGSNSKAFFGPGDAMYPSILPDMADDAQYYMKFITSPSTFVQMYYSDNDEMYDSWVRWDGFKTSYVMPASLVPDEYNQNSGQYYFYAPYEGLVSKGYDSASNHGEDFSEYEGCPFYFVNGGLVADYSETGMDGEIVRYPNESQRGFYYRFYGPGRDLFSENRNGDLVNVYHHMVFKITTWKPMIGSSIRTRQTEKHYDAQLYMTINGASVWTGCDMTPSGYFP